MGNSASLRLLFGVKLDVTELPWYDEVNGDGDYGA
jgi:hypothetical protein